MKKKSKRRRKCLTWSKSAITFILTQYVQNSYAFRIYLHTLFSFCLRFLVYVVSSQARFRGRLRGLKPPRKVYTKISGSTSADVMNIIMAVIGLVGLKRAPECIKMHHFEGENDKIFGTRPPDHISGYGPVSSCMCLSVFCFFFYGPSSLK